MAVAGMEAVARFKQEGFELLELAPGKRVLDVGCGAGDDVGALAELVGPEGRAVGVDVSEDVLDVARERVRDGAFVNADGAQLPFEDGSFDAVRGERVLECVAEPETVVAEMVRVLGPGGRLAVCEPDWDGLVVDASDLAVTRRILGRWRQHIRHSDAGRRLYALAHRAGLADVSVHGRVIPVTDLSLATEMLDLAAAAREDPDGERWLADLEARDAAGHFFLALTGYTAVGRKPSSA